jgi:hypothetical protein
VWLRSAWTSWLAVVALQQAAGDAQQVAVVLLHQARVDVVAREAVQRPVVGCVDAPERRAAGVGKPG